MLSLSMNALLAAFQSSSGDGVGGLLADSGSLATSDQSIDLGLVGGVSDEGGKLAVESVL